MRPRLAVAIVLALALPALAFVPIVAAAGDDTKKSQTPKSGDAAAPAPSASGRRSDPNNVTGLSPFMAKCIEGNNQYLARDFTGAIATYREAIRIDPKRAL